MYGCLNAPQMATELYESDVARHTAPGSGSINSVFLTEVTVSPHTSRRRALSAPSAWLTLAQLARRVSPATSTQR